MVFLAKLINQSKLEENWITTYLLHLLAELEALA